MEMVISDCRMLDCNLSKYEILERVVDEFSTSVVGWLSGLRKDECSNCGWKENYPLP